MPPILRKLPATPTVYLLALALGVCAWIKVGPNFVSYILFLFAIVGAIVYVWRNVPTRRS
jgi:hypothetical protein